jgi:hypothetical protein
MQWLGISHQLFIHRSHPGKFTGCREVAITHESTNDVIHFLNNQGVGGKIFDA